MVRVAKIHLPPFGIASTAVIFAYASHLSGTVSFDRYLEANPRRPAVAVDDRSYVFEDLAENYLESRLDSNFGSLAVVVAAEE